MKYRKRPVVIEAVQFTGKNMAELERFGAQLSEDDAGRIFVPTLEGSMLISPGDYLIKGVAGEFYPCKPEIFNRTYEGPLL